MELTIECSTRDPKAKANVLRRQGLLPAVLYGHNGTESLSLTVPTLDAEALLRRASVNNTLVNVKVSDTAWKGKALIREVQTHPWKEKLVHLSFFAVAGQDEVEVTVPLNYSGEASGVKDEGGILNTELNELTIKCSPESIPEVIDIDVSNLGVGDSLTLGDLVLPKGVEAVGESEVSVVAVLPPKKEAAPEEELAEESDVTIPSEIAEVLGNE
ncbi:50S ribosomal protein L25 [Halomicronema hongdechloris C2206]|uniref:Large ribosomal subunit protein bL25 n=1 Tax=Halomicronema hongdechloris C2206 TaxID=1641165 RepID=A0A1Z3HUI7_9CYAN|nr:50S ribosomal protein L25/general stress protein Ctc [Halomicronema hongdechloris]ASC73953.1 50S ribosomal protein L25 [Halomicronema hongdechloris C2206]